MKCQDCGAKDPQKRSNHYSRGLCRPCYNRNYRAGTLIDYERTLYPRAELLSEWDLLRREGFNRRQAAARLGITKNALNIAIARAQKDAA